MTIKTFKQLSVLHFFNLDFIIIHNKIRYSNEYINFFLLLKMDYLKLFR